MSPFSAVLRILLLFSIVNSCARLSKMVRIEPTHNGIDPRLSSYVSEVKRLSKGCLGNVKYAAITNLSEQYDQSLAGMASYVLPNFKHQIELDDYYWKRVSHIPRLLTVAHELYHIENTYFYHINEVDEWGCAKHFMFHQVQSYWCDVFNFEKYVKQMQDCHDE
jgi:hypothetical protein